MRKQQKPFKFLEKVDNLSIINAISDEHPQTIAIITSCLSDAQAAFIIECLPPERQLAILRRIATTWKVNRDVLTIVENELKVRLSNDKLIEFNGVERVAEILTNIEPETTRNILENLSQDDPELVSDIRDFTKVIKAINKRVKSGELTVKKTNVKRTKK